MSGFFTALFHAVAAVIALMVVRNGEGPYVSAVVFACVITLVCCLGLVARSHFCSILLLLQDVVLLGLAVAWCVATVLVLRSEPAEPISFSDTVERAGDILELVGAGFTVLVALWLTRRTYRLEKRLRTSRATA